MGVLKWMTLHMSVALGDNLLRSHFMSGKNSPEPTTWFGRAASHWVHANRMFRDLTCSSFLLLVMVPMVAITSLNTILCPGCSIHQLLIYRDTGHQKRLGRVILSQADRSRQSARDLRTTSFTGFTNGRYQQIPQE